MLSLALGSPPLRGYNAAPPGARWSEGVRWQGRRMGGQREIMTAARRRRIAISAAVLLGIGCGMVGTPASSHSLTDRCKSLVGGGKSDAPAEGAPNVVSPEPENDLTCPPVSIRAGASTYAVAAAGKQPVGNDLRFQATITRTARQCTKNGDQITARIGIQGRVIAGPAGAPSSVTIPLRVAVVQGGVQEKTIATKAYQTTVSMPEESSEPFSLVAEDLVYPVPQGADGDSYIFYIGFDPQALAPEPKPKAVRKQQ